MALSQLLMEKLEDAIAIYLMTLLQKGCY